MTLLDQTVGRVRALFTHTIWQSEVLGDRSPRGRLYSAMRVASMTLTGIVENGLASRAGALSFSSVVGFGPLVALVVLVSSMVLERTDKDFAQQQLNRALVFVAPQLKQLQQVSDQEAQAAAAAAEAETNADDGAEIADPRETNAAPRATEAEPATSAAGRGEQAANGAPDRTIAVNPQLQSFVENVIKGAQSKAVGAVGALGFIFVVIQLLTTIENAFNGIWGVKRGRNWMTRIVFYWAAVTLGAVLAFTALTLLSASTLANMLGNLPFLGASVRSFFEFSGPLIAVVVLVGLLAVFYKFIPNTSVGWRPALIGAVVVVLLLNLNNFLAFLYVKQVVVNTTFFGSLVLPIILMLGLYVFWLFLLVGGQITYAVQNANYRSSHMAWHDLRHIAREGIALLVFTLICRRFHACRPAFSAPEISEIVKIPTQILNVCLARLINLGLVSRIPPDEVKGAYDYRFQPARPLDRVTLVEFKELFEGLGDGPTRDILDTLDPVVRQFHARLRTATMEALGNETMDQLIQRFPVESLPREAAEVAAAAEAPEPEEELSEKTARRAGV